MTTLTAYDVACFHKYCPGDSATMAHLARVIIAEAVDRLAGPLRFARALFMASLAPARTAGLPRPRQITRPVKWSPAALASDCMRTGPPALAVASGLPVLPP
jgi:hypothetical protein